MKLVVTLLLAASALSLAACADTAGQGAIEAKHAMIGMPKAELLACAGAPERQAAADGKEFLTYTAHRADSRGAPGFGVGGWSGGWGYGGYYAAPAYDTYSRSCTATFVLVNGRVVQVTYGGDASLGAQPGLCWPVVGNCLAAAQRLRGLQPGAAVSGAGGG